MISRYARVRIDKRFGGFNIVVRVRNDLDGSLIKVVPDRANFKAKIPNFAEVIRSARHWTKISENESDIGTKEQQLKLLLDQRYDYCLVAAQTARRKRIVKIKRAREEAKRARQEVKRDEE